MYPDFSYIFHDLLGSAPDNWLSVFKTFGFFLVLAILSAARILFWELRRKAGEGIFHSQKVSITLNKPATAVDYAGNIGFGFLVGFKLLYILRHFETFQADAAAVIMSLKGDWFGGLALGAAFGVYQWYSSRRLASIPPKEEEKEIFPHNRIGEITMIAAVAGVLGAKVFAIMETPPDSLKELAKLLFSGSGLTIYGGLIGGFLGVAWYLRKHKIPLTPVLDAVAPALIVAYGVGRLGCHFSGDGDWGIAAGPQPSWWFLPQWLWAYDYPHNIINEGVRMANCTLAHCKHLDPPVFPTSVYESLMAFSIGGILWALRKKLHTPGLLFFTYLIFNGLERFFIEKIRVNVHYDLMGFKATQAEIIAVLLLLTGIAGWVVLWRRKSNQPTANQ